MSWSRPAVRMGQATPTHLSLVRLDMCSFWSSKMRIESTETDTWIWVPRLVLLRVFIISSSSLLTQIWAKYLCHYVNDMTWCCNMQLWQKWRNEHFIMEKNPTKWLFWIWIILTWQFSREDGRQSTDIFVDLFTWFLVHCIIHWFSSQTPLTLLLGVVWYLELCTIHVLFQFQSPLESHLYLQKSHKLSVFSSSIKYLL